MISIARHEFDQAVRAALASIPQEFQPYLENVVFEVRERPDRAFQREHNVPDDLLGLYVGVPLEDKHLGEGPAHLPDRIYIFAGNLCDMCETYEELIDEIRVTVLHEVGHHFGLDEDRLAELGYD